jgi:hypothetical protein
MREQESVSSLARRSSQEAREMIAYREFNEGLIILMPKTAAPVW